MWDWLKRKYSIRKINKVEKTLTSLFFFEPLSNRYYVKQNPAAPSDFN